MRSSLVGLFFVVTVILALSLTDLGVISLANAKHTAATPRLSFIGLTYSSSSKKGLPICNESVGNHKTFQVHLTGFTPNGLAMIIIRYPNGQFYWYHKNYGVVRVDGGGNFLEHPWPCWIGPNGTMDPTGKYFVTAIDFASNLTAQKASFMVVKP